MSENTTIYVNLRDENVDVRRPVQAARIQDNVYLILDQPYDRKVERWEFEPGARVVCELVDTGEGQVRAAVRLATQI